MNIYLLTNQASGAQAVVFARAEHEARYRRPDGAVWRLGRWYQPGGRKVAPALDWWPGTPHDVYADPVLERIDTDEHSPQLPPVVATRTGGRRRHRASTPYEERPRAVSERPAHAHATIVASPHGHR